MRYLIYIGIFFLTACHSTVQRHPEPDNLIPKDKMIAFMSDLMKVEGHIQMRDISVTKYYKTAQKSGQRIFKKHNISESQFEESLKYYGTRQIEMEAIYDEILNQLNDELAELPTEEDKSTSSDSTETNPIVIPS